MFDKNIYGPRELKVNINEHRAPTDDSIRIFNELQEKAISSVIDVGSKQFSVNEVCWVVSDSLLDRGIRVDISLYINGKRIKEHFIIPRNKIFEHRSLESRCEYFSSYVREFVVNIVSREISYDLFKNLSGRIENYLGKI